MTYISWSSDVAFIFKTVWWWMNVILWDNEPVGHDLWPHNKCRSQWPIFHGLVILFYILNAIWLMNIILWDHETLQNDLWPQNKCMSQWPIFHGPVTLPNILKTIWMMNLILWDNLKINVGHSDLYFMVQWFCPVFWRPFEWWTSYFGLLSQCDKTFDLKINVTYISWSSDFPQCLKYYSLRLWVNVT